MRRAIEYRQASKVNYERWKEANPSMLLTFVEYQNIIYTFNTLFRDYLLETGEKGKLPWGVGDFVIVKYKKKRTKILPDGREVFNLPVNWKETRKAGHYIYHLNRHTEGFGFRWKWFPNTARYKGADIWIFKPSRITSRILNHYLTTQSEYQHRYFEW